MKSERYTTKCERNALWDCDYEPNVELKGLLDKLGPLEDVEEELGIDLVVLLKALKNGIYVKGEKADVILFYDTDFFNKTSFQLHASNGINYYLKDYGKTWALTMEELYDQEG